MKSIRPDGLVFSLPTHFIDGAQHTFLPDFHNNSVHAHDTVRVSKVQYLFNPIQKSNNNHLSQTPSILSSLFFLVYSILCSDPPPQQQTSTCFVSLLQDPATDYRVTQHSLLARRLSVAALQHRIYPLTLRFVIPHSSIIELDPELSMLFPTPAVHPPDRQRDPLILVNFSLSQRTRLRNTKCCLTFSGKNTIVDKNICGVFF